MRSVNNLHHVESLEPRQLFSATMLAELSSYAAPVERLEAPASYSVALNETPEQNVYSFTGETVGRMHVTASEPDVLLNVYNARGRRVRRGVGSVAMPVRPGRMFYVRAETDDPSGVELAIRNTPRDDFGNSLESARDLRMGASKVRAGRGRVNYSGDQDVFALDATRTAPLSVSMLSLRGDLEAQLSIYDSEGNLLTDGEAGANGTDASIMMESGQRYYIVASGSGDTSGVYRLRVVAPRDEHGNDAAEASAMRQARGVVVASWGRVNYGGDHDFLSFTAEQSGTMTLRTIARGWRVGNGVDTVLRVYDSEGNLVAEDDDSGAGLNSRLAIEVEQGQQYFVEVLGYGESTGLYRVVGRLEPLPAPPVDGEALPEMDPAAPASAEAGSSIMARIVEVGGLTQLWITGTDGNDVISLGQSGETIRLTTSAGVQNFAGSFDAVQVFGFGGDDVIRMDHTVSTLSYVYGDAGNDQLFAAGSGAYLYGGDGDDLLVSVGGSPQRLYGGAGVDSFWFDTADTVSDANATERANRALHQIREFYQPYTTNQSSSSYVPLTIAGQNLTDPTATSSASGWRNYADSPLFVDGPQHTDVNQGAIGDCYFLASLSALAETDAGVISEMIAPMGDGTYAVRYFRGGSEVYVRVDADLPVSNWGLTYADRSDTGEIWVALAEKAYAYFRYGRNSYASLNAGWMADPLTQITNQPSSTYWMGSSATGLYNYLSNALAAGHGTTLGSNYNAASPVVGSHAYSVHSVESDASGMWVNVYNPWGVDGASYDSNSSDGMLRLSINTVLSNFSVAIISMA
jgi:hypothetical protein